MTYADVPLADRCHGRWADILTSLGASPKWLNRKHQSCPLCNQGRDCFRFTDYSHAGMFFCNKCGHGDGVEFVKRWKGVEFVEAAKMIEQVLPGARPNRSRRASDQDRVNDALDLLRSCVEIGPGSPAALWLKRRVPGINWRPEGLAFTTDGRLAPGRVVPAMVGVVRDRNGKACQAHRTFLTTDGEKALADKTRLVMSAPLPDGCAIRLAPKAEHIGVTEGIETALSCTAMFGLPVWALIAANNLEKFRPPEGVRKVTVFGDRDASFTGQAASYALAKSLRNMSVEVDVQLPLNIGDDWNDVHMRQAQERAA